jgi:hypothetical protein
MYKLFKDDISPTRFSCPTCDQRVIHDEGYQWMRDFRRHRDGVEPVVGNLWKTNEPFREDIKNLYKIQREFTSVNKEHGKSLNELKKEWKKLIEPYKAILKSEKEKIINKFKELPLRSKLKSLIGKMTLASAKICETYDIGRYNLFSVAQIPGAPKIARRNWYHRYRTSSSYLFSRINF